MLFLILPRKEKFSSFSVYMIIQESKSQNTNYLGLTSRGLFLGRNGQKPGQSDKEEPN